ncbi:MAG TPA: 4'-phosphopantetheinyl transferase superfamily protein [Gemmatimonadales bacterium]|nr:4'-phosphopantetheinyl transferase superfamily protein [Gemmatimonadales bacterium]
MTAPAGARGSTPRAGPGAERGEALRAGVVHVWRVDLGRETPALSRLVHAVPPAELAEAHRFRVLRQRRHFLLARGIVRTILARYLGMAPAALNFRYGPHGKPELPGAALHFSVSHARDLLLCAVCRTAPVGVDVERVRSGVADEVTRWLCSTEPCEQLRDLAPRARREAFFRAWTRMEACVKAQGGGLAEALAGFPAFLAEGPSAVPEGGPRPAPVAPWWLLDFSPRRGYAAALALPEPGWRVQHRGWWAPREGSRPEPGPRARGRPGPIPIARAVQKKSEARSP